MVFEISFHRNNCFLNGSLAKRQIINYGKTNNQEKTQFGSYSDPAESLFTFRKRLSCFSLQRRPVRATDERSIQQQKIFSEITRFSFFGDRGGDRGLTHLSGQRLILFHEYGFRCSLTIFGHSANE